MNTVLLSGCLASDPAYEEAIGDSRVAVFVLKVERNPEEADLFPVRFWDQLAQDDLERLIKGQEVTIEGVLRQDTTYRDGNRHQSVLVVARRVECV